MTKTIKIGFLGSGWSRIAQAPAFSLMENVELAAVASPTELHRQKFMKMFDISKGFADWRDMLQCDLDLVCVTTPTYLHTEMVNGVLESGKSVLCEKPFALSVADAASMVAVATTAPGLALIDHQLRFHRCESHRTF